MNTTLAVPKSKQPLRQDEYIVFTAGRTTIRVQCIRPGQAYTVVVEHGSHRIEDQCTSIDTEGAARAIARAYAHLALQEAGR